MGVRDQIAYKKPMVNMNMRMSLCLNGSCSLSSIGNGKTKIATSVTMFKLDVVYQNFNV